MADFDYQKMNDYVSADPEVTKLRQQKDSALKKIKILKQSSTRHIEKMHGLYLAKTAVMEKVCLDEASEIGEEHYLEKVTGQCSECWAGDWQEAAEVVFDASLACSVSLANLAKQITRLSEEVNLINGCLDTLEDELRKQFRTQFYKDQQTNTEVEL